MDAGVEATIELGDGLGEAGGKLGDGGMGVVWRSG